MRALRWTGQSAALATLSDPVPAPGEALVRVLRATLTTPDLAAAQPGRPAVTLGRAFVGTVQDVHLPRDASPALAARAKLKGQRVVAESSIACLACDLCRAGLRAHCRQRRVLGQPGRDGVLAELVALPLVNLHAVPAHVDLDQAVFAEPLAAAAHSAQLCKVEGKPYISVLGDGRLGLLTVQVMARLNASVRLLGRHAEKFTLCERWCIKHRHESEVGRRQDQDIVVDCTGSPAGLRLAMGLVRPRGKIILKSAAALPAPTNPADALPPAWREPVDLSPIVANEIELIGGRDGPLEPALTLLERGEVQITPLITRRLKLTDGPAILDAARTPGAISVVIEVT